MGGEARNPLTYMAARKYAATISAVDKNGRSVLIRVEKSGKNWLLIGCGEQHYAHPSVQTLQDTLREVRLVFEMRDVTFVALSQEMRSFYPFM